MFMTMKQEQVEVKKNKPRVGDGNSVNYFKHNVPPF